MEESVGAIRSGISVQIRRTDGRTHPAIISRVNPAGRSVTVEWSEKGETKGKEVEFEAIYALNMHLHPSNSSNQNEESESKIMKESRCSWEDEEVDDDEDIVEEDGSRQDLIGVDSKKSTDSKSTPTFALPYGVYQSRGGGGGGRGVENIPPETGGGPGGEPGQNYPLAPSRTTAALTFDHQGGTPRAKRSSVLKEVEKLKKKREERRKEQAERKEEKEALMNQDPGNPNWQFNAMIREFRNGIEFRPLREDDAVENHQITVCVRKRPLNKKELRRKEVDVVTVPRRDLIVLHEPKSKVDLTKYLENQQFRFDYVFDEQCTNDVVYKFTAKPLVQTIFDGGMATCFAYGQTGSGKTHTMGGTFTGKNQNCQEGIYAMVAVDVFKYLNSAPYKSQNLIVTSSFFEIYSGKVFDLLAEKAKLRVLEDGKQQVQVVGLTEKVVTSVDHVLTLIHAGNQARTSGQTSANSNSSRSHAVFQITLRVSSSHQVHGKFSLIDLAGNERGADTSSADRQTNLTPSFEGGCVLNNAIIDRRAMRERHFVNKCNKLWMEGAEINKSLLALKECIRALGRKGAHLPFRVSKLTQVLRDSFIGEKTKTCMIAMISPGMSSCEHSLNTLRYADRVKELAANDLNPSDPTTERSPAEEDREDDLAALRSLNNEGEISADLYHFHEAVSQLNRLEEEMLDRFKVWRDSSAKLELQERQLLQATLNVDYDQDAVASQLQAIVNERMRLLAQLDEKVTAFRHQLIAEEEISKKMTPPQSRPLH